MLHFLSISTQSVRRIYCVNLYIYSKLKNMISSKKNSASSLFFILLKIKLLFPLIITVILSILLSSKNALVVARSLANDNPTSFYKECTTNEHCPTNYCCTVGMMRYTRPFCSPMGILDEMCRPDHEKLNLTLSFPFEETLQVIDSYLLICPCLDGLKCSRHTGTCLTHQEDYFGSHFF